MEALNIRIGPPAWSLGGCGNDAVPRIAVSVT